MLIAVILGGAVCPEPILKVQLRMIIFPGQCTKNRLVRKPISAGTFHASDLNWKKIQPLRTTQLMIQHIYIALLRSTQQILYSFELKVFVSQGVTAIPEFERTFGRQPTN